MPQEAHIPKLRRVPEKQLALIKLKQKIAALRLAADLKEDAFDKLKDKCTHVHASGDTSIVGGWFGSSCDICGWNDF